MELYLIGLICEQSKTVGYVMLDLDTKQVKRISAEDIVNTLEKTGIKLKNAKVVNGRLAGKYYSLKLLPVLNSEMHEEKIILKIAGTKAVISDKFGQIMIVDANLLPNIPKLINYNYNTNEVLCTKDKIANSHNSSIVQQADLQSIVENNHTALSLMQFAAYMKKCGCKYKVYNYVTNKQIININEYNGEGISIVLESLRFKTLHLPKNTIKLKYFSDKTIYRELTFNKLIFNPEIKEIENIFNAKSVNINEVYFQTPNRYNEISLNLNNVLNNSIIHKITMPSISKIEKAFNWCVIDNVYFSRGTNEITNSFNDTVINQDVLDLSNVNSITDSFTHYSKEQISTVNTLVLSGGAEITNCFKNMSIKAVKITQSNNTCEIKNSFIDTDTDKIGLYTAGAVIKKSFLENKNKILMHIHTLESDNPIEIDESFISCAAINILTNTGNILLGDKCEDLIIQIKAEDTIKLTRFLVSSLNKCRQIKMDIDKITGMSKAALMRSDISLDEEYSLSLLKNIKTMDNYAFQGAQLYTFDTINTKQIQDIPKGCFLYSTINTLVINKNIKTIPDTAFYKCSVNRLIILSDDVVISDKAFNGICENSTVFITEHSKLGNKLKALNINYYIVDSDNPDSIINPYKSNKRDVDTQRLLDSSNEYSKPETIEYAGFYSTIDKQLNDYANSYFHTESIELLDKEQLRVQPKSSRLPMCFINMCNFIMKHTRNCNNLYTKELQTFINSQRGTDEAMKPSVAIKYDNRYNSLYKKNATSIFIFRIDEENAGIAISIDREIVYITSIKLTHDISSGWFNTYFTRNLTTKTYKCCLCIEDALAPYITPGDDLVNSTTIGAVNLKKSNQYELLGWALKNTYAHYFLIGMINKNGEALHVRETDYKKYCDVGREVTFKALYFVYQTNKFIECSCEARLAVGYDSRVLKPFELKSCTVMRIYDLEDIDKINPKYFEYLLQSLNDEEAYNALKEYSNKKALG